MSGPVSPGEANPPRDVASSPDDAQNSPTDISTGESYPLQLPEIDAQIAGQFTRFSNISATQYAVSAVEIFKALDREQQGNGDMYAALGRAALYNPRPELSDAHIIASKLLSKAPTMPARYDPQVNLRLPEELRDEIRHAVRARPDISEEQLLRGAIRVLNVAGAAGYKNIVKFVVRTECEQDWDSSFRPGIKIHGFELPFSFKQPECADFAVKHIARVL